MSGGGNPSNPPKASYPVPPPTANVPVVDTKTGLFTPVGLNLIQQIWAALAGSGGSTEVIAFLESLAQSPPFVYSSPDAATLPYKLAALQIPGEPVRREYTPFVPNDPVSNIGVWTPTLTFGGGSTGMTFSAQLGNSIAIGSLVVAFFQIDLTAKGSSTGAAVINGLPFNSQSSGVVRFYASCFVSGLVTVAPPIAGQNLGGQSTISLVNGDGSVTLTDANLSNNSSIRGCMIYKK